MVSLFPHLASFRFHLTVDTLAFGYLLPAAGRTQGVVPLKRDNLFWVQKKHSDYENPNACGNRSCL